MPWLFHNYLLVVLHEYKDITSEDYSWAFPPGFYLSLYLLNQFEWYSFLSMTPARHVMLSKMVVLSVANFLDKQCSIPCNSWHCFPTQNDTISWVEEPHVKQVESHNQIHGVIKWKNHVSFKVSKVTTTTGSTAGST